MIEVIVRRYAGVLLSLVLILSACRGTPLPVTDVFTPMPTIQITTPQPTTMPTLAPSSTPFPTSTPTATPAPSLPILAGTPVPLPVEPITPQNAERIQELAIWGKGSPRQVAFSPDGKLLAVGTTIGIWLYDAQTFELVRFIETPAWVGAFVFAPEGTTLHAEVGTTTLFSWDVGTGKLLRSLRIREGYQGGPIVAPGDMTFSQNAQIFAATLDSQTIGIWDVESGERLRTLVGHTAEIDVLTLSPDGTLLASSERDRTTWIWDVRTGVHLHTIQNSENGQAFSPDERILAIGSQFWDVASGELIDTQQDASKLDPYSRCAAFSDQRDSSDALFAEGWENGTILVWNAETGQSLHVLEGHTDDVISLSFSPDATRLVSGSYDGTIRVWGVRAETPLRTMGGYGVGIVPSAPVAAFFPDNTILFAASDDSTIKVWDPRAGQIVRSLIGHDSTIVQLAASADGKVIASTQFPGVGAAWIWDAETGQHLRNVGDVATPIGAFALSPDGTKVAIRGGAAHWAMVLNVKTGEEIYQLLGDSACSLSFSPNGTKLAANWFTKVELWDVQTGESLHQLTPISPLSAGPVFSPDSKIIASASWTEYSGLSEGTVWLWDAASGNLIYKLDGFTNFVYSIAFSPNGTLLATGTNRLFLELAGVLEPSIWLWDARTGTRLHILQGYDSGIAHLMFSPDGTLLMSTSPDGTVRLWGIPPGD